MTSQNSLQEVERANGSTEADKLVNLVLDEGAELFTDELQQPCVVDSGFPLIARKIKSREAEHWLSQLYWDTYKKAISPDTISRASTTLEAIAIHSRIRKTVYNRVAQINDSIYYDLGDDKHVVEITQEGWHVKTSVPVLFRRYKHQLQQPLPVHNGDLKKLKQYINIEDEKHEILLLTYLPVCLLSDIDRPLLLMHGPQGAGKSTALGFIRALVDPSKIPLLTPPRRTDEMIQQANKHYMYLLDNVSKINQDISDTLCRFVTGSASSKRALYTDDDDFMYEFKRATGFTSIAQLATNPDLLDRSIIIQLQRITEVGRKKGTDLWKQFETELPQILGGLFDAVSGMLRIAPSLSISKLPRLADYSQYATAVAEHLGYGTTRFSNAYTANVIRQNQEAIESSPTIQAILAFMRNKPSWEGSSTLLYGLLKPIAESLSLGYGSNGFPRDVNWLWRKMQEAQSTLDSIGLKTVHGRRAASHIISITKTESYDPAIDNIIRVTSPFSGLGSPSPSNASNTSNASIEQNLPYATGPHTLEGGDAS